MRDANRRCFVAQFVLGFAWLAASSFVVPAKAQGYPERPVKIVVPFPAGGTADAMPRLVGDWLSRKWGQPVVIENRSGAAGNIGAEAVYRSDPDGYTLLSAPPPPLVIKQNLYPRLGFDPAKFEPVIVMAQVPNALLVNPNNIKASSLGELIDYLQKNPGKVTSATQGNGTTSHLTSELFSLMAKVKLNHVPYRGSAGAVQDVVAGHVKVMFMPAHTALPFARNNQIKVLAIGSSGRSPQAPDVPTLAEAGFPGTEVDLWYGLLGPAGTPAEIVARLNAETARILRDPKLVETFNGRGVRLVGNPVAEFTAFIPRERARWAAIVKASGVKME